MFIIDLDFDDSGVSFEFIFQSQFVWIIIFFSSFFNGQDGMAIGYFLDVVTFFDFYVIFDLFNGWFGVISKWNFNDYWFFFFKGIDFFEFRWYIDFGWSCKEELERTVSFCNGIYFCFRKI